jgi:hypothetical protein
LPAISTQNVVTGSRAIGTVYRNTSARPMFVTVSILPVYENILTVSVYCDSNSSPTTVVMSGYVNNQRYCTQNGFFSFWVLPGNYYKLDAPGSVTVQTWAEWI